MKTRSWKRVNEINTVHLGLRFTGNLLKYSINKLLFFLEGNPDIERMSESEVLKLERKLKKQIMTGLRKKIPEWKPIQLERKSDVTTNIDHILF